MNTTSTQIVICCANGLIWAIVCAIIVYFINPELVNFVFITSFISAVCLTWTAIQFAGGEGAGE
ncbi:unnamed protein product [marine sediment metagenome]|uniref:Uncharacterized protein n=1 Tax=marine sediment metagenome TaxID=412755 RepID=X0UBP0_9ZZZZ